ncbi:MAG TPA: peptidylprolyl isomerase [Thermodesulfobacteriota bacterium]
MRSTPRLLLAALAIAAALVPFHAAAAAPSEPAKGQAAPGDVVIATVDDQVVTRRDLDEAISRLPEQYRSLAATPQGRKQVLDNLILTKLLYARARAQGTPDDPRVKAQVQAYAEQAAIVAMIQEVADRAAANVPERDLRAYYDANKDQFLKSEAQVRASHILVETEAQARQLREEILAGRDFAEAAKASSKDKGSADRGGDLGFFTKERMVPEFADAAFRLEKPGDLSPVVKTPYGYHIIRLEEKRPAEQASFDDVKDRIAEQLRQERQQRAVEEYVEEVRAKAKISIDESKLAE